MTDPTTPEAPASSSRSRIGQFRAELLLQLLDVGFHVQRSDAPAGEPSSTFPDLDLYDRVEPDLDYKPAALADWAAGVLAEVERDAIQLAAGDVEALELSQAAIIELAAAYATFVEVAGQAQRLEQVRAIVRRGMTLTESYDLANTLEAEVTALKGRLSGILGKYPELQQLMSADVTARSAELQRPDGSPIAP